MKSLFVRIFLSFWIAQALFVVLAILVTIAFRPRSSTWEALRTTVFNDTVTEYEEGGEQALRKYLDNLDATQHVRAYLFDEQGNEVSRRGAPDWAIRVAAGGPRIPHDGFLFPAPPVQRDSRASSDGKHRYTVVLGMPPGPRVFIGPRGVPITGLIIGVITSGLVVLSALMVPDQADCSASYGDAPAGGGRSDCPHRCAHQQTARRGGGPYA